MAVAGTYSSLSPLMEYKLLSLEYLVPYVVLAYIAFTFVDLSSIRSQILNLMPKKGRSKGITREPSLGDSAEPELLDKYAITKFLSLSCL